MCNVLSRKTAIATLVLSFSLLCIGSATAAPKWGSKPVSDRLKPVTSWVSRFSEAADIVAESSIQEAVERCDSVVGRNRWCVVELNENSVFPVDISRSRTKLVGAPGSTQWRGNPQEDWITVSSRTRWVVIEGLNMEGVEAVGYVGAIRVEGDAIRYVVIRDNTIKNFHAIEDEYGDANAHAIAIYGSGVSISQVLIDNNDVFNMRTGTSESIVVNGNVLRWQISNNNLRDLDNIAIDAIGGEGTFTRLRKIRGREFPGSADVARIGFIEGNTVTNLQRLDGSWAAAIYIDGARDVNVKNNSVSNAPFAYSVGAENCVITRNITLEGNSAEQSVLGDAYIGGYALGGFSYRHGSHNCNPSSTTDNVDEGHGWIFNVTMNNNQFSSDPDVLSLGRSVFIEYRVLRSVIANVEPQNSDSRNGYVSNDGNTIRNP